MASRSSFCCTENDCALQADEFADNNFAEGPNASVKHNPQDEFARDVHEQLMEDSE